MAEGGGEGGRGSVGVCDTRMEAARGSGLWRGVRRDVRAWRKEVVEGG